MLDGKNLFLSAFYNGLKHYFHNGYKQQDV